jgi:hypothetical protein
VWGAGEISGVLEGEVQLPVNANAIGEGDVDVIIENGEVLKVICRRLAGVSVSTVVGFEVVDECLVVNDSVADGVLAAVFGGLVLPLLANVVSVKAAAEIAAKDADQVTEMVSFGLSVRAVTEFSRTLRVAVGEAADEILERCQCDSVSSLSLVRNDVDLEAILEIAVDDVYDAFDDLQFEECSCLDRFTGRDPDYDAYLATDELASALFEEDQVPIIPNCPASIDIERVTSGYDFQSFLPFSTITVTALNVGSKATVALVHQSEIAIVRESFFAQVTLPVQSNFPSRGLIHVIPSAFFERSLLPSTIPNITSLARFEIDDGAAYLTPGAMGRILEGIFDEFEDELPIVPNEPTNELISAIVKSSQRFHFAPTLDVSKIVHVHPIDRKIDFKFPLLAVEYFESVLLPVSANCCSSTATLEILSGLQPLHFVDFVVNDCDLLLRACEAPEEVIESIDTVVANLMALVLNQDVMPELPLWKEIAVDLAFAIVSPLLHEIDALKRVAELPLDSLAQLPSNEIPPFSRPADVLLHLLQTQILPRLPLRRRKRDFTEDVDAMLARGLAPRLAGEELQNPLVAAIVRKYKRR